jgi:8-oxo-dGTP diphosphatase
MYSYKYPRPSVTVDALLFAKRSGQNFILLIERGNEPFRGKWALPGGFMDMDETLEEACRRELEEETGIRMGSLTQFKTYDAVDRDPRGRTISVVFWGMADIPAGQLAGDDAVNAGWFPVDQLPELAFDHALIIAEFLERNTI